MTEEQYAKVTCYGCKIKLSADKMQLKEIKVVRGGYSSRKSVTPLTFIGALLGSKKASGALESWMFNTSNRKGKGTGSKEVRLCPTCATANSISSFGDSISSFSVGGLIFGILKLPFTLPIFIFKFVFKTIKWVFQTIKWVFKIARLFLSLIITISPYGIKLATKIGLGALVTVRTSSGYLASKRRTLKYQRNIASWSDEELLKNAFESKEFIGIAEYLFAMDVANADGITSDDEVLYLTEELLVSEESKLISEKILNDEVLYLSYKNLIKNYLKTDNARAQDLVVNLFYIAELDGKVCFEELEVIRGIANDIGVSKASFVEIEKSEHKRISDNGSRFVSENTDQKITELLKKHR